MFIQRGVGCVSRWGGGWSAGECNLIVVQMLVENQPDNIEASCQIMGEWNLVCFGVCE